MGFVQGDADAGEAVAPGAERALARRLGHGIEDVPRQELGGRVASAKIAAARRGCGSSAAPSVRFQRLVGTADIHDDAVLREILAEEGDVDDEGGAVQRLAPARTARP